MTIGIGFTCKSVLPESLLRDYHLKSAVFSDGATRIAMADIHFRECDNLIAELIERKIGVESFNFSMSVQENAWSRPDSDWIAAILLADEFVRIDPMNEFNPSAPPPCFGIVRPDKPIRILERPKGQVVRAKYNEIFSSAMCDFLGRHADGVILDVIYNGTALTSWHRFCPTSIVDMLDLNVSCVRTCLACKMPIRHDYGVWIGRRQEDLAIAYNRDGIGHLNAEKPCLLSPQVACKLEKEIGAGYGLQPIIDVDSRDGRRIKQLLDQLVGFVVKQ